MDQLCEHCRQSFIVPEQTQAFLQKMTFRIGGTDITLPEPRLCPDCRLQLRTLHRNERFLYKNRSAFSGKEVVSIFAPEPLGDLALHIYGQDEWVSDAWDPLTYGRDYDFNRPFFDQFKDLLTAVPQRCLITHANENSDFSTGTGFCRNCYLINSSEYCEDCYYGKLYQSCKNCVDCSYLYDSERCYECFSVYNSWNCTYLWFSKNCRDCHFSSNLTGCSNCFLCTNLTRKEYHFFNEPLSKEDYEKRVAEVWGSSERIEQLKTKLHELRAGSVQKYANIVNAEDCTGDCIENSKHCHDSYDMTDSEDCRFVTVGVGAKDCEDCSNMYIKPELCWDTLGTIEVHHVAYCHYVFYSQNMLYCSMCYNSKDCFGCISLNHKQYCVFNKQYSKEEYERLVSKIVEHMTSTGEFGRFFPASLSPFGYNETLASEYFPLTEEQAKERGFQWRSQDVRNYSPQTATVPDSIDQTPDSITQEILRCSVCTKNYRIIPQELAFYRDMKLPIPTKCPDCRYSERMMLRNPRKLWDRNCAKCGKPVRTTYAPDRPEIIYCETCYQKEVY